MEQVSHRWQGLLLVLTWFRFERSGCDRQNDCRCEAFS